MARRTGPKHRICRRVGEPICGSPKCPALKRPYPPGQHGRGPRRKLSEYGRQLLEKQKLKAIYGISETQLRNLFRNAARHRGRTGELLLQMLETRLDNIVYRMGLAPTLPSARQLVTHGHVTVDGRKVDIPSYRVQPGQRVGMAEKSRNLGLVVSSLESTPSRVPYVEVDPESRSGTLLRLPSREEIPIKVNETLVVEFYAR
ncbi:MAG: 30S ribosomal protein S4 [Firmicutes bacterium]|nr:30S ribosomal protein S4 [Bacillota bacterium]